jgi:hypothetical protein
MISSCPNGRKGTGVGDDGTVALTSEEKGSFPVFSLFTWSGLSAATFYELISINILLQFS